MTQFSLIFNNKGSERKKLKIKNPEEYRFRPKDILRNILQIYIHLESADTDGAFAKAIALDGRSYKY